MGYGTAVQRGFDRFGKEAGLEKKSGSWYGRTPEVISVSNLQKSQYGPSYYVNQAFYLRHVDDEKYQKHWKAHIRARLEYLLPDCEKRIPQLLNLEYPMEEDERIGETVALLKGRLLRIILRAGSLDGLRAMNDEGAFRACSVSAAALQVFQARF